MNSGESKGKEVNRGDRELRIEKLKRKIEEVTGAPFVGGTAPDCDPALEEAFLEHVLALETHGMSTPFEKLIKDGLVMPPPDELDDAGVSSKLWEVIHALAARRLFLHCTDHLDDRQLYEWLWKEGLREEFMGFGMPFGSCHLDVLGGCSDKDIVLQLKYYADDDWRALWASDFPEFDMPEKERPPYDRDRFLPKSDDE